MKYLAVVKIVELIGSSPKGWEDATKNALAEALRQLRTLSQFM